MSEAALVGDLQIADIDRAVDAALAADPDNRLNRLYAALREVSRHPQPAPRRKRVAKAEISPVGARNAPAAMSASPRPAANVAALPPPAPSPRFARVLLQAEGALRRADNVLSLGAERSRREASERIEKARRAEAERAYISQMQRENDYFRTMLEGVADRCAELNRRLDSIERADAARRTQLELQILAQARLPSDQKLNASR
jgi:hypothetical protein